MNQPPGFRHQIFRVFLLGAATLLTFHTLTFHIGVLVTENNVLKRRMNIVAPFHLSQFAAGKQGIIEVDPLLTLYESHDLLPRHIAIEVPPDWTGSQHLELEQEKEYQLIAQQITVNGASKIVYAVEDANPLEWDDTEFLLAAIALVLLAMLLFLVPTIYMIKATERIASPFLKLAEQLKTDSVSNFAQISPGTERSREFDQILQALNAYRSRLERHIKREQSFTRYVSHELRTPIMVIKGTISNLRRSLPEANQKPADKIAQVADQMAELTTTLLMLARDNQSDTETTQVNTTFLDQLCAELEGTITANETEFHKQLVTPFEIPAQPQLFKAVLHNLLNNAFACSVNGKVTLTVTEQGIEVVDNGVGLDSKPRGYEGFGIGLVLVEDICNKYGWDFYLANNPDSPGCTASVGFRSRYSTMVSG